MGGVLLVTLMITAVTADAQVSVSVNIGMQPDWGPVGYDYVEYYYLPAYEIYYYVPRRQFVYWDGVQWVFVTTLPPKFRTVNLYTTYKVVINEPKPYIHHEQVKVKYVKYKEDVSKQVVIRDSKDPKYVDARKKEAQPEQKAGDHSDDKKAVPQKAPQKNSDKDVNKDKDAKKNKDKKQDDKHPKDNQPK